MTDVRTLKNAMLEYESKCKVVIPENYYYIVKLIDTSSSKHQTEGEVEIFFDQYSHCRLILFYPKGEYYILFDPLEKQPDHVSFATELCSAYTRETGRKCMANVIEFSSQMKVFIYYAWVQKEKCDEMLIRASNGKITKDNIVEYTFSELKKILSKNGKKWEDFNSAEKYGTFYKRSSNGDDVIGSFCYYNFSDDKKFLSDIFSSSKKMY